ncbi:TIGR01777 family oxidoreductase [Salibacter halophilus]|uniref:TIGR01777 family protein n=1 Tax=Salibacter halophilus TaxID=1803916 RepID=A0A6N6M8J6_9FLAO|nr:TIGR01777 family oxidoreductase [Salibacter halophilus]KAB1063437.1 TIGR01777 family protein [Salibacter halophilus]
MAKILITGGSGLIGKQLTALLQNDNHEVCWLSRSAGKYDNIESYSWDPASGEIDESAIKGCDYIVHLAGAGVADERWTEERKKIILNSRVDSTKTLVEALKGSDHQPKAVICASAIGYYGFRTTSKELTESSPAGDEFLASVTKKWETETDKFRDSGIRTAQIRIGIVLSKKGGALDAMTKPPLLSPLGTGKQWMPWIHIDDLTNMFYHAIKNDSMNEPFNAVAPNPVSNKEFTKLLAKKSKKLYLPIPVPPFALKMVMGEMAGMVLEGSKISCEKIVETGFQFKFDDVEKALDDLF